VPWQLRYDKQNRRDLRVKVDARDYTGHSGRDHDLERLRDLDERTAAEDRALDDADKFPHNG
jgi:hypothetical protein